MPDGMSFDIGGAEFDMARQRMPRAVRAFLASPLVSAETKREEIRATVSAIEQLAELADA